MNSTNNIKILNIASGNAAVEDCLIEDHLQLHEIVELFKKEGKKIVYTMGAFDIKHIGHERYLRKAKEKGDILIVGCDSDEYIRETKGADRPIVPYSERSESLINTRPVNIVTVLPTHDSNLELVKLIKPDVVVLSFSSTKNNFPKYEEDMKNKYGPYCGEVVILERQAETSTSARIRIIVIHGAKKLLETIDKCSTTLKDAWEEFMHSSGGIS